MSFGIKFPAQLSSPERANYEEQEQRLVLHDRERMAQRTARRPSRCASTHGMDVLKLGYELDQLSDLVEERTRLVSVLGLAPTANDNVALKRQLGSILESMQECAAADALVCRYNAILDKVPDAGLDKELYRFHRPLVAGGDEVSKDSLKKVRFKNDDELTVTYRDDDDDDEQDEEEEPPLSSTHAPYEDEPSQPLPMVSNQELFIDQQQQLLEQDSHLGTLSQSIGRTHDISMDLNDEIVSQNDTLLVDLESLIDNNGRNLNRASRSMHGFNTSRFKDNGNCVVIIVLILVLLLLLLVL